MRFIAASSLILILIAGERVSGQSSFAMSDPVFGIEYDTREVHFEYAPESLVQHCPDTRRGGQWWIYAHWKSGDEEIFVISSLSSQESGAAVVISGGKCTVGNPDWVLTGDPKYAPLEYRDGSLRPVILNEGIKFTDPVLHGLASDLLRRYAAAFGGKNKFLSVEHKDGLPLDSLLKPVLKSEFEKFAQSP